MITEILTVDIELHLGDGCGLHFEVDSALVDSSIRH